MQQRLSLLIIAVSAAISASADATLDSCRIWARDNYPAIRHYDLIEKSAKFDIRNAAALWAPRITVSAQGTWQTDAPDMGEVWETMGLEDMMSMLGKDIPDLYMRKLQGKVQLDIQQTIWDGGASTARKRISKAEAEKEKAELDIDMRKLNDRVDEIYFGILLLDEQRKQADDLIALLDANLARAESAMRNGTILKSDVDAIKVEILTTRQRIVTIEQSRKAFRSMLSLLTSHDLTYEELTLPEPQLSDGSTSPERKAIDAGLRLLDAQEKALWVASMPKFGAFAQGWYGYPGLDMFASMENSDWSLNAVVGVSMKWNIHEYYTIANSRKKIAIGRQRLDTSRELLDFNNQLQRQRIDEQIGEYIEAMKYDDEIVGLRKSIREAAESKYRNGTITVSELLQKVTEEHNAKSQMTIHRIEKIKAINELNKIQ